MSRRRLRAGALVAATFAATLAAPRALAADPADAAADPAADAAAAPAAAATVPDAPPLPPPPEAPPPPAFTGGIELAGGYALGSLVGEWPEAGATGGAWVGLGLYPQGRAAPGPRVGAELWARLPLPPTQQAVEGEVITEVSPTLFGLDVGVRSPAAGRWSGVGQLGFGRMDLPSYLGVTMAVPVFSLRAAVERKLGPVALTAGVRTGFGAVAGLDGALDDLYWFDGQLGVAVPVR